MSSGFKKRFLVSLLFPLFIPAWFFFGIPALEGIPENFEYQADIFSLDNFFDEKKGDYLGEQISKTRFSYRVIKQEGVLLIKNSFDVRTLSGGKIFAVERVYGIHPKTGQHVPGFGDRDREGYLFAPRFAGKDNYTYWHINYDNPATMTFQEEVELLGLPVYRFEARYHADQTKNLSHLPGVPEERGINLDITLQTWIEPITGRLIKYQDNAIAYYYDLGTGQRIHPWNKFANTYTHTSVEEQVALVMTEKRKLLFNHRVIPWMLAAPPLLILLVALGNKITSSGLLPRLPLHSSQAFSWIRRHWGGSALVILLMVAGGIALLVRPNPQGLYTIGIGPWHLQSEEYKRNIEGFKEGLKEAGFEEGKNIRFLMKSAETDKMAQRSIIQSFADKKVDLIYSLTTQGTLIAKGVTQSIPIVFSIVTYPVETGIIENLHRSGNNLVGTRNYIPVERQYALFEQFFTEKRPGIKRFGFVHRRGEPNSERQFTEFLEGLAQRGITVLKISASSLGDLAEQLSEAVEKVDVLYGACDTLMQEGGEKLVIDMAIAHKKIPFTCNKEGVLLGALAGNVADFHTIGKMSGKKAALILEGTLPTHLATETMEEGHIAINQKTAHALGISIPEDLLRKAHLIVQK
jgi:putative ABC transport system substrate-binding protein